MKKIEENKKRFTVGDVVTWASAANGSTLKKQGKITAVVPPREVPEGGFGIMGRNHESYLVEVVTVGKRGPRKPRVYWPLVSKLKLVRSAG